jgi:hypothetical protein
VITMRNAWTMPQERYNAEWVVEHGLGIVVKSNTQVRSAAQRLLAQLETFKTSVAAMENRAVFEVPDVLAGILRESSEGRAPTADELALGLRVVPRARSVARALRLVGKSFVNRSTR